MTHLKLSAAMIFLSVFFFLEAATCKAQSITVSRFQDSLILHENKEYQSASQNNTTSCSMPLSKQEVISVCVRPLTNSLSSTLLAVSNQERGEDLCHV